MGIWEILGIEPTTNKSQIKKAYAARSFFMEKWEDVKSVCRDPEERRWWKDYLGSEDFQDIKWHPALVEFLGEDMERQLSDDYVIRLYFWDAYGFQAFEEEEGCGYPVSLQKLWWALYPAAWHRRYQYQEIDRLAVKWRLEREQERRKIVRMIFLALVAVGLFFFIKNVSMAVKGSRYAETYMRDRYPQETFSKPERVGKTKNRAVYEMNSLSHPEITVQVEIDYGFHNEIYGANENYGLQLLQYYGEGYGLTCGEITKLYPSREKVCVLYYSDEDALGEFCDRVERMFEESQRICFLWEMHTFS